MTDTFSKSKRSWIMSRVQGKDTTPELIVRSTAHRLGYRFRLHRSDLPGKPDIAFPFRKKVIFVNGCFWHGHKCARGNREPKTNKDYWKNKIARNKKRDCENTKQLKRMGWNSLIIWECQVKNEVVLVSKLINFLEKSDH